MRWPGSNIKCLQRQQINIRLSVHHVRHGLPNIQYFHRFNPRTRSCIVHEAASIGSPDLFYWYLIRSRSNLDIFVVTTVPFVSTIASASKSGMRRNSNPCDLLGRDQHLPPLHPRERRSYPREHGAQSVWWKPGREGAKSRQNPIQLTCLWGPERLNVTIPAVMRATQRYSWREYLFFAKSTPNSITGIICALEKEFQRGSVGVIVIRTGSVQHDPYGLKVVATVKKRIFVYLHTERE